jgi:hypothetical protein
VWTAGTCDSLLRGRVRWNYAAEYILDAAQHDTKVKE